MGKGSAQKVLQRRHTNGSIQTRDQLTEALRTQLFMGCLGGSVVEHLPLAQVVIPGSWDQVLHWAPHKEPASPPAYVSASLCVLLVNKIKS